MENEAKKSVEFPYNEGTSVVVKYYHEPDERRKEIGESLPRAGVPKGEGERELLLRAPLRREVQ